MKKIKLMGRVYEYKDAPQMVCDICGKQETAKSRSRHGSIKKLANDHCHETGIDRGQLCQRCNMALGLFNDDIEILKSAIKYLEITQKEWDAINEKRMDEWYRLEFPEGIKNA